MSINPGEIDDRQQAHALVDRLADGQLAAVVSLLQFMLSDPVSRALAAAQVDEEEETAEEREAVAEAHRAARSEARTVSQTDVLREFGLA